MIQAQPRKPVSANQPASQSKMASTRAWFGDLLHAGGQTCSPSLVPAPEYTDHQVFFGGEESIDPFQRQPGRRADLIHPDGLDALRVEKRLSRAHFAVRKATISSRPLRN
ncbi:hypothetical protein [Spongiactinospora sp. 9N601]|uniref:hypothetical protein n=1 Tax=Spongiactinospora sp. 9N601 TaxID=3375149 RepID=UPI0037BAD9AD